MNLKLIKDYKKTVLENFKPFYTLVDYETNLKILDIKLLKKKMKFVNDMQDLIYNNQDIIDTSEMILYDYYSNFEIILNKVIQSKTRDAI